MKLSWVVCYRYEETKCHRNIDEQDTTDFVGYATREDDTENWRYTLTLRQRRNLKTVYLIMFYYIKYFILIGIVLCAAFVFTFVIMRVSIAVELKIVLHHLAIIYTIHNIVIQYYFWPVYQCGNTIIKRPDSQALTYSRSIFPIFTLSKNILEFLIAHREWSCCNRELMRFLI